METKEARFVRLVGLFTRAIVDKLAEIAKANGGVYAPSTDTLRACAFAALAEVIESESEPVHPMLATAIWETVLKINESAFRQGLARQEKAGTLPFKMGAGAKTPTNIALQYC